MYYILTSKNRDISNSMTNNFNHVFPAIRGVQSGRPCYVAMVPMRIVPKLFIFDEAEVPTELRAQRSLNVQRIPEISAYLVENSSNYTLSSITASIDSKVNFEPNADSGLGQNMGTLSIPMEASILINDGQHRRAAIERALKENTELGHDNISVLFFIDEGLSRSQQMFADLNKHAVRPSDSISTLYDLRDDLSKLAREVQKKVHIFKKMTEMEKSSISNRSSKLFTLSAIKNANKALLGKGKNGPKTTEEEISLAALYWNEVASHMPDWQLAHNKKVSTYELRENQIHAHGVFLQSMGKIGYDLLSSDVNVWQNKLKKLEKIDWSRTTPIWEGRAMNQGRISKAHVNVILTGNAIKKQLGVELTLTEETTEERFLNDV